ncbi:flagellar biosynthetic protein FliO, partial [Agrobacterium sp. DKPNP3]
MMSMMDDFIGTYGNNLIVAVVGVGVALLILAIVLWLIRRRSGSAPFIRGGRNRQPRLQVLDATAVDARRRLVLVRRDNVEHLVMIGGPTDIVIESGIGAIPIVRDVQEPELKALPRQESEAKKGEAIIQQERRASLPQQAATASVSIPEEPARQTQ